MTRAQKHLAVTALIAAVWIGFGLLCKVLGLVPRHEQIVAQILGAAHAGAITRLIGGLEVLMGLWVLSGRKRRWCAVTQIVLVGAMNLLEVALAPDLLLWGPWNSLFALAFIWLIWLNEWRLGEPTPAA